MMEESFNTIKYCKKCGCELASTSRYKLCDNCRRDRAMKTRNGALGVAGTIATALIFVATKGKFGGKKN